MLFEPEDKSKISRMRLNVCPSTRSFANIFSEIRHQSNSPLSIMQDSKLAISLVAANDAEFNKAKVILDSINNQLQAEHDARAAQKKAEAAAVGKNLSFSLWNHLQPILPFTFIQHEQPNCFIATVNFDNYKYLGTFITQFQITYPELKSDVLDKGYVELTRRIELAKKFP